RRDDEPRHELSGVRRRAHHDPGRSGAVDRALRLRDLRADLPRPVGRASECPHRRLLRPLAPPFGAAAACLAGPRGDGRGRGAAGGHPLGAREPVKERPIGRALAATAASAAAIAWLLPYAWMVATSLKRLRDIADRPASLWPRPFDASSYGEV